MSAWCTHRPRNAQPQTYGRVEGLGWVNVGFGVDALACREQLAVCRVACVAPATNWAPRTIPNK